MLPRRIIALPYIALGFCANTAFAQDLSQLPRDGDMRGLVIVSEPVPVSDLPFVDEDEVEGRLSDYRGKYVVLNFWATWCAPCREEMPSLEALQRQFGSDQFEVVTLATGRNSPQAIRRFFEEIGVEHLPIKPKMYLRVTLDLPISYEEAQFIKETYISTHNCREITLIPQKQIEEITTDLDISAFEIFVL